MGRGIIKPLPETVRSSVRSGVLVFDLTRVVEELIFNSLDAGATKVSVAVGVGTGYIKVTDNGSGVTRDGLMLLGERYATSKSNQLADMDSTTGTFGFRGEALGSISDVSLLEIVTKAQGRPNGYRKVIKGCKCLYVGIDDARHDVGTTVIVRDLFYNQPVRRKQMQSSPRKILHSLKECVLKIALVHLKANFKVFDIESGDELLHAHPSSSPLPLLMSCFGVEATDLLHEFDVSDGLLKISGYISGPCDTFSGKAVQYVYINSRFVCKGPIHKLLSQLAETFDGFGLCNDNNVFDNGKRTRVQNSPSYILNLGCPLSLYDLTFEPSKTSVEFKDWGHILAFLEKAITKIWTKCLSYGHCFSHDADMLQNDNTWKGDTSITSEEENAKKRKKRKVQFLDLPSPKPKMPTEFSHLSPSRSSKVSCLKSSITNKKLEKHQEETGFTCQTNYSALCDGVISPFRETLDQENRCHLEIPDVKVCFTEDYFLENNYSTGRSNKHMDCITSTECNNMLLKVDTDITGSTASGSSAHCFEINNDVEEIRDTLKEKRSFLKSFSSRRGILPHRSFSVSNEEFDYKCNAFENRELWVDQVDKINVGVVDDSNQTCEAWKDERASIWCSPMSRNQDDTCMGPDTRARDPLQFVQMVGECFDEDSDLPLPSVNHFKKCLSRHSFLKSGWSFMIPNNSAKTKLMEADHYIDQDACENRRIGSYQHSADKEKKDYIFGFYNIPNKFGHLKCFASSCMERSGLDDYPSSGGDICNFYIDNVDYNESLRYFDIHSDQAKEVCLKSSSRDNSTGGVASSHRILSTTNIDENKDPGAKIRTHEKAYENRPKRSHSAPPFYKGKKKFSLFNCCSEAQSTQIASTHDPFLLKGTYIVGHDKQSSAVHQLSSKPCFVNDSLNNTRPDTKTADIYTVQNCEMQTGSQHLHANLLSEDSMSKKNQETRDLLASEVKWRSSCQMTTKVENSNNLDYKVETVLDISSGILHLAGDTLVPKSINKDCFEGAKVLQQVDRKYIPVVGGGVLAFIDQHAADERIRLEELRLKVLSGEMKTVTYLDIVQELVLPEFGHQLLQNYAEIIRNWGWICNIHTHSSRSFNKNMKLLHCQPSPATLIAVPCILGVSLTDADLLEFLQQLADTDGSSTVPPSVFRVLNFKACRGAIMFGDVLLPSECSLIVEELKQTSLCFQCAHGRPTTAPIVNLELLHKQISNLGLESSRSNGLWQGLRRHKVSLERAVQRLNPSRCH